MSRKDRFHQKSSSVEANKRKLRDDNVENGAFFSCGGWGWEWGVEGGGLQGQRASGQVYL